MVHIKLMPNLDVKVSYDPSWALKITPGFKTGATKGGGK